MAKCHPRHLTSLPGQEAGLGLKEGQAAKTLLRPGSDDDTRREAREEEREKGKRKEGTGWERGGGRAEGGEGKGRGRRGEGRGGKRNKRRWGRRGRRREEEGLEMEPLFTLSKGREM